MNIKNFCIIAATATILTGCASSYPVGVLYQEAKLPVNVTSSPKATKVGTAQCKSFLGLIVIGDASIEAAKKSAGITEVTHIDWEVKNVLGFVGEYKLIVYGN